MAESVDFMNSQDYIVELRQKIQDHIVQLGFEDDDLFDKVQSNEKDRIRNLHSKSVEYFKQKHAKFIEKYDDKFIERYIANGHDIDPAAIDVKLQVVDNSTLNNVFNWAKMHWSIPVSSGYGRRLRYLVIDKSNDCLIGLIGLGDPVFGMRDRETFIGWNPETRKKKLKNIMEAYILGSLPPYNLILGGKLTASLVSSSCIISDFRKKYRGKKSLISGEIFDGKLAAVTTTSALGRSSLYDRISIENGAKFLHVGWTSGSGDFHFLSEFYDELLLLAKTSPNRIKNPKWGNGIRNRREVINYALKVLDLPRNLVYHNIKRELFLVPMGEKYKEFLNEKSKIVNYYGLSVDEITAFMKRRWVLPRSKKDHKYLDFSATSYKLNVSEEDNERYRNL